MTRPKIDNMATPLAVATLLCFTALVPAAHAEDALARLFFTPERRLALDRQRELNITEPAHEDPTLTIDGVVTRSSGKRTAWVNGVAQNERATSGGISVSPLRNNPGKVIVEIAEMAGVNVRVGETVSRDTGETSDLLNGGRIVIKRPGAK